MTTPDPHPPRAVSVIVPAFGAEPLLAQCATAVLASTGVDVELIVIDNGCTSDAVGAIEELAGVRVLRPGVNTGFAGGCNLGASQATHDVLAFVNSDAIVEPGALAALVRVATAANVGLATASLRLLRQPELLNSAGNPIHYLGTSWAGALGEPAARHAHETDVASISGAAFAVRRQVWEQLGGFWEELFAYCEDTDLSWRCWQLGLLVRFVPDAVVLHDYEFSRNPEKLYLVERNRLLVLLTLYEASSLARLLPALVAFEAAVLLTAVRGGWWRQKLRGWWWIWRHRTVVTRRRREIAETRRRNDADLARLFAARWEFGEETGLAVPPLVNGAFATYWRWLRPRS